MMRVPGDCVFFPRLLKPCERLQHQLLLRTPMCTPCLYRLEQVRMEACDQ